MARPVCPALSAANRVPAPLCYARLAAAQSMGISFAMLSCAGNLKKESGTQKLYVCARVCLCPGSQLVDVKRQSFQKSRVLLEAQQDLETAVRLVEGHL